MIGHFLRKHGPEVGVDAPSIQPEAVEFLQRQRWPGNVRELENVIRQSLLLARSYTISIDHVREVLRKSRKPLTSSEQNHAAYVSDLLTRAERGEVQNALAQMMTDLEAVASWCASSVLLVALVAAGLMAWTANLGGKVRHTEIRGSVPVVSVHED
jgi:DNA-binding NtrC family response regulator